MFGTYRLLLASLVALSHFGLVICGLNPGQWAVISFYVISGYLMDRLFGKTPKDKKIITFYVDRFLRIYPLYLFMMIVALSLGSEVQNSLLSNVTLIPLNYSIFNGARAIIGPAWSLACEAQFYLLVPVLFLSGTPFIRLTCILSIVIFCTSPFYLNSTFWAYFSVPGILFAFTSGMLLSRNDLSFLAIVWGIFSILLTIFLMSKFLCSDARTGIHINVCIGFLIALPSIYLLSCMSPKVQLDQRLGLLSYPLFLIHEVVQGILNRLHYKVPMAVILLICLFGSLLLAIFVEIPADRMRYWIRKKLTSCTPA